MGVALLWMAVWHLKRSQRACKLWHLAPSRHFPRISRLARAGFLTLLLLAALWSCATAGTLVVQHPLDPTIYDSDAAAFVHYQAEDVLQGINPYSDQAGFWKAIKQFPEAGATPLRRGRFSQQPLAPDDRTVSSLLHTYAQNPGDAGPEFDPASMHSYPAGAFLLAVPFIWAGLPSTQPLYALGLLVLFVLLCRWAPQRMRRYTLLILATFSVAIVLTLRSSFEVCCILGVLGAWRTQERHPWISAMLLGLGCSVKQLAWLFVPFYLIWVNQRAGWRQASISGTICILTFFGVNAPFLLGTPGAWAGSMFLPVTEPAFPGGIGLTVLTQGGLIPASPLWIYTTLEITCYLILLTWYTVQQRSARRNGRENLTTGTWTLLAAPLPLLLAPRSLISYTMFLPILALAATFQQYHHPSVRAAEAPSALLPQQQAGERAHKSHHCVRLLGGS